MAVCIVLILMLCWTVDPSEAQRGVAAPALLGEEVTFACSLPMTTTVNNNGCTGQRIFWVKSKGSSYISDCLTLYPDYDIGSKYRVTLDGLSNTYYLQVADVQQSDAGKYECVPESGPIIVHHQLNVNQPSCFQTPLTYKFGDDIALACDLKILRELQWIAPNGTILGTRRGSNDTLITSLIAGEEDNFREFTCVAVSASGAYNPNCTVTPLEYEYITITPTISRINQGDNIMFNCNARLGKRAPHRYNYTWLQDGVIVLQGINMISYTVDDIQRSHNDTRVQCRASNDGGEEMESDEAVIYVLPVATELPTTSDNLLTSMSSVNAPDPSSDISEDTNSSNIGLIVGCIGGIAVLLIVSIILVVYIKRKKTRKSTNEVEAPLSGVHKSTSGTGKGHDPKNDATSGSGIPDATRDDGNAVYALPAQKGGGHLEAKSLNDSHDQPPNTVGGHVAIKDDGNAVYAQPAQKGGGHIEVKSSNSVGAEEKANAEDDANATYATPTFPPTDNDDDQAPGDVGDDGTASPIVTDSHGSQPNVEGLLYADLSITNAADPGEIINTTEPTLYADIQRVE